MNKRTKFKNQMNISGIKIREFRESQKWSREYLSNKLLLETGIDISAQTIAKIEYNSRTVTDYEFLGLVKILKIDIHILIKDFFNN